MKYILFVIIIFSGCKLYGQGFAVVELYTSQGCSSCPAADKNFGEIVRKLEEEGKQVYGLSFHVDYWNYIGWKDPYSSKEFTKRQNSYAGALNLNSIYTPQMIVNGSAEFIGSDKNTAKKNIDAALKQKPSYIITLSDLAVSGDQIQMTYSLNNTPSGETLNLAIVERDVENFVPKGENTGKTLHHENVVRSFSSMPLQQKGIIELKASSLNLAKSTVIVFVQNKQFHIVAATSIPLN